MDFSPTELLTLVILLAGSPLLLGVAYDAAIPGKRWFMAAYVALLVSNVCTLLESWFAPELFNTVEHGAIAAFGVLFLVAARAFSRDCASSERAGS